MPEKRIKILLWVKIMVKIQQKGVYILARRGENIRKRNDGRWEGRYIIRSNECKKYRSVYGHSYNEVRQKLINCKNEMKQLMTENDPSDSNINEISQLWLENVKITRK